MNHNLRFPDSARIGSRTCLPKALVNEQAVWIFVAGDVRRLAERIDDDRTHDGGRTSPTSERLTTGGIPCPEGNRPMAEASWWA